MLNILELCSLFLIVATTNASLSPKLIPRKTIFSPPDYSAISISPDGLWISWIAYRESTPNVWVTKLPNDEPYQLTFEKGRGVLNAEWAFDNRTVIYSNDKDGDENWRLYSIDVYSKKNKLLTEASKVAAVILKASPKHPYSLIIGLNNRDPRYHDAYKLNIRSGQTTLLFQNNEFAGYFLDDDLKIRLLWKQTDQGGKIFYKFLENDTNAASFPKYRSINFDDVNFIYPLKFDKTNRILFWMDNNDGKDDLSSLYAMSFDTREKKLIYRPVNASIYSVVFHPISSIVLWVDLYYDKPSRIFFDKSYEEEFRDLAQKLKFVGDDMEEVWLTMFSLDFTCWIVKPYSAQYPSMYHLYNRTDRTAKFLFWTKKSLLDYTLVPVHVVSVPINDNLTQLCYFTLPEASTPESPQPTVLFVHGGPWSREFWGFDAVMQYFTNRGYVVIKCNFRSSTNLGKRFQNAGNGQWGLKMQQDLTNAVSWFVEKKLSRPDKVAIFGGSYGGYAVLSGLTSTPDLYACGVDVVGPSNLVSLMRTVPPYWKPEFNRMIRRLGGDPNTTDGRRFLESVSPVFKAHLIKKPLLIAQGANDPRVPLEESVQMAMVLRSQSIPFTFMLFPREGHGFARPQNTLAFFAETEQFLAKCLGGRAEKVTDEIANADVMIEHFKISY